MTQEEKQEIISSVLASVRTNSRTIGALTPVTSLSDTSQFEINGGKRVSFSVMKAIFTELIRQKVNESERNILEALGAISDFGGVSEDGLSLILGIRKVADESGIREFDASVQTSADLSGYPDGTRAWVEDIHKFVKKESDAINPIDAYLSGSEPRQDLLYRFGNRLYCWRDGKLVQFVAGLDDELADVFDDYFSPWLTLSQLDNLGTDGSPKAMLSAVRSNRATRFKVVEDGAGANAKAIPVGLLDVVCDGMGHVITEILTTHCLPDATGAAMTANHRCSDIRVYWRSLNISSPQITEVGEGMWTKWRLLNGDEVHLDPTTGQISREDMPPAVIPFAGTMNVSEYEQQHLSEAPAGAKIYYDEQRERFFLQTGSALDVKYYPTWGGNEAAGISSSAEIGPWPSSLYLTGTELWGMVEGRLQRLVGGVIWEPDEGDGDPWILGPLANQVEDTGPYDPSKVYRCKYRATATAASITHDCWYCGCRYRCKVDGTVGVAPCYGSPNWEFISGNPDFTVDFEEKMLTVNMNRLDTWSSQLTLTAQMYNQSVIEKIPSSNIKWKRESYDAEGNRRTASDNAWTPNTTDGNKKLLLHKADLDYDGTTISKCTFLATVTLGSQSETIAAQLTQMLAYVSSGNLGDLTLQPELSNPNN